MGVGMASVRALLCALFVLSYWNQCLADRLGANQSAVLLVDGSPQSARKMPDNLFGLFFEEINHAGAGGLWAELVSNRGFEAGGQNTPSNFDPWFVIGNETYITVATDSTSCFSRNKVALRMEVQCGDGGSSICPTGGVGVYNPGYWGMNIEQGKSYKVIMHVRSLDAVNLSVSLTSSDGLQSLASGNIIAPASVFSNWTKMELLLQSTGSNSNARLQVTAARKGVIWLDQVSLMPLDTYKRHGFRKELAAMLADLKPRFIRFPGGCFVEGEWLRNAFRWRETIGPWEERPGHFGDVWMYWTDDGLGYFEFLQLAEDLGASPVWVVNNGVSHNDQVDSSSILPFVQDTLDSIEFARGDSMSTWGSVRAAMGHPEPFELNYIAIGNEDCGKKNYRGNYLRFYYAIKAAYPEIQIISNCDGSDRQLDHPADLYDFHVYTSANDMFSRVHQFDRTSRSATAPKAFVSEYAVTGNDAGHGSLLAALGEASFLIGLETNSDVVEMASYAPLFVNDNDHRWNPDAIVFNSWQQYGTPSYWMQHFFKESSGSMFHPSKIQANSTTSFVASAITWQSSENDSTYLKIKIHIALVNYRHDACSTTKPISSEDLCAVGTKYVPSVRMVVNFGSNNVNLKISVAGLQNVINSVGSTKTILTSSNLKDENSFSAPNKVVPIQSLLQNGGTEMDVLILPHSVTSFDLSLSPTAYTSAI